MKLPILNYRVIDGDTIHATLDMGLGIHYETPIRLSGISAPEIRTSDPVEKRYAIVAKKKLTEYMDAAECLECDTVKRGAFGRVLGTVFADGEDLNQRLLTEQFVDPYGGKK